MSDFEKVSLAISIVALIISVVSIVRARKTQAAFLEFEKIHVELSKKQLQEYDEIDSHKKKTNLSIEIVDGCVFITNIGNTIASDITIDFPNTEDDRIIGSEKEKLPYPMLNPNEDIKLAGTYNAKSVSQLVPIKMAWKNIDGSLGEYTGVLQP